MLSTSWREHWSAIPEECNETGELINELFCSYGLNIFDKTPRLYLSREQEIKDWLDNHPEVTNFVVLDDMFLSAYFLDGHFVKTSDYFGGLDENDVRDATDILTS